MRSQTVTMLTPESIDKHHNWCIARGQSENTARAYRSDLREFLKYLSSDPTLATGLPMESFEDMAMYWLNQTRRQVAPKTTGRRLTSLRNFSKWAGYPGLLADYVAPVPARGQPHPIPELLDGLERMLNVAHSAEQKAIVGLCGFMGMRIGEALSARPEHFDLNEMRVTIRGKGDRSRVVPVSQRGWSAISTAFVDATLSGNNLVNYQDRSARKAVTSMGARAGLSRAIASHDLRATFATIVYNKTRDQRVVQELLGHASGTQTELYIGISVREMAQGVEF